MSNYRRAVVPGGTFFFTVVTFRRRHLFDKPKCRKILRQAIERRGKSTLFTPTTSKQQPLTINPQIP